jgi:hypothetical protein
MKDATIKMSVNVIPKDGYKTIQLINKFTGEIEVEYDVINE